MEPLRGLSSKEVAERVAQGRTNASSQHTSRSFGQILRANLLTRFNFLLGAMLVSSIFVPVVLVIAVVMFLGWAIVGSVAGTHAAGVAGAKSPWTSPSWLRWLCWWSPVHALWGSPRQRLLWSERAKAQSKAI